MGACSGSAHCGGPGHGTHGARQALMRWAPCPGCLCVRALGGALWKGGDGLPTAAHTHSHAHSHAHTHHALGPARALAGHGLQPLRLSVGRRRPRTPRASSGPSGNSCDSSSGRPLPAPGSARCNDAGMLSVPTLTPTGLDASRAVPRGVLARWQAAGWSGSDVINAARSGASSAMVLHKPARAPLYGALHSAVEKRVCGWSRSP